MQDLVLCLIVLGIGVFGYFLLRGVDRFWDRRRSAGRCKSAFYHTFRAQPPLNRQLPPEQRRWRYSVRRRG